MRSQLSQFCQHFDTTVRPLLVRLDDALQGLSEASAPAAADELRGRLTEVREHLGALVDKVAQGQAYVLIFGPLKSGKSTLMNALSGAYVSEVSSLPAYPCLVFVGDGPQRRFEVFDYEGGNERFTEPKQLRARIDQAHNTLAERVHAAEARGELFDPQQHCPGAIRRVDVRLPAPALKKSGAVLVDTPGLYTRMRFGYDRMTRDFRNAAACAVFVVKTDNLFLEQVFTEFHQLLELFSRIFLVVNVDTTKRDVGPGGELVPSVEQHSPQRIIEAFENYAMSAPLKQAAKEGRLRLYPVDLMHAASAVLAQGDPPAAGKGKAAPKGKPTAVQPAAPTPMPPSFARFRDDLEAYLKSSDYLVSFLRDSLQRAHGLLEDALQGARHDTVMTLHAEARELEGRRAAHRGDLESIATCLTRDWSPAFQHTATELEQALVRRARDAGGRTARAMGAAIDTWSLSGHSLHHLLANEWAPLLRDYRQEVEQEARRCAEQASGETNGGLRLDGEVSSFLRALGIGVGALRSQVLAEMPDLREAPEIALPIDSDEIPVRRGVLDLVTLRSDQAMRRRLFGPREKPDRRIPARVKKSRLGEAAHNHLRDTLMRYRKELFPRFVKEALARYRDHLRQATVDRMLAELRAREPELRDEMQRFQAAAARLHTILAPLDRLATESEETLTKVHALSKQYGNAVPELLAAAKAQADAVLQPQAPAERHGTGRRRRQRRPADT